MVVAASPQIYMGRCPKAVFKSLVTTSYLFPFKNSVIRSNSSSFLKVMEIVPLWAFFPRPSLIATRLPTDMPSMAEVALIENLQREDLNPIEECEAYQQLMNHYGLTQEQMAAKVGKSRPYIANMLRLAELPSDVTPPADGARR